MITLEHQGVKGMKWGKRKSIGAVAGTATSIYLSTPEGRKKLADAANKVRSAYMR